ncbi:hypothetical protein [Actinokineospora diospyrosa]|uniref:Endonuclease/Exonuclease/phosphatase family protein n=1 Tax=Actinokineospora diospyrosa TaxID=103728 RepID=A0ABT1IFW8_9PSEU|nr:hypothetical protein [Actinokineospora diospyrosa]MCP2271171.1 Endonuclease/Exonuclease/phosphatase family protein [Actinokineospora diospyrosa]
MVANRVGRSRWAGVVAAATVVLTVVGAPQASAKHVTDYELAAWNTHGANTKNKLSLWQPQSKVFDVTDLAATSDVVALQEVGKLADFDKLVQRHMGKPYKVGFTCKIVVKMLREGRECDWTFPVNGVDEKRKVFVLRTDDVEDSDTEKGARPNMAFVVRTSTAAVRSWNYLPPVRSSAVHEGDRGLLQLVLKDNTVIYNVHADAKPAGGNVSALLKKATEATAGLDPRPTGWVMLGDLNIESKYLRAFVSFPIRVVDPGVPTHDQRIIDYLIWSDPVVLKRFTASVPATPVEFGSDHDPVTFTKKP